MLEIQHVTWPCENIRTVNDVWHVCLFILSLVPSFFIFCGLKLITFATTFMNLYDNICVSISTKISELTSFFATHLFTWFTAPPFGVLRCHWSPKGTWKKSGWHPRRFLLRTLQSWKLNWRLETGDTLYIGDVYSIPNILKWRGKVDFEILRNTGMMLMMFSVNRAAGEGVETCSGWRCKCRWDRKLRVGRSWRDLKRFVGEKSCEWCLESIAF